MFMSRRLFFKNSARALGGGASLFVPHVMRAQHWANCHSGKQVATFQQANAKTKIAVFSDWCEGDCEMRAAILTLNSNGTGTFASQVCTHFTHSKDIWHFYVELAVSPISSTYLTTYSWDGPKMSEQDHPLYHAWQVAFHIPTGTFQNATCARATSCC